MYPHRIVLFWPDGTVQSVFDPGFLAPQPRYYQECIDFLVQNGWEEKGKTGGISPKTLYAKGDKRAAIIPVSKELE